MDQFKQRTNNFQTLLQIWTFVPRKRRVARSRSHMNYKCVWPTSRFILHPSSTKTNQVILEMTSYIETTWKSSPRISITIFSKDVKLHYYTLIQDGKSSESWATIRLKLNILRLCENILASRVNHGIWCFEIYFLVHELSFFIDLIPVVSRLCECANITYFVNKF